MIDINVKILKVKFKDKLVGYLKDFGKNKIGFQYSKDWVSNGFSISPFSLPLNRNVYFSNEHNENGLFGVFNDSLPEGWGGLIFERYLNKIGINPNKISPLTKLSLIGKYSLGGLCYEPLQNKEEIISKFDLDNISKDINNMLNESEIKNLDVIYQLSGSTSGSRPKINVKIKNDYWIIKFPCSFDPKNIGLKEFEANSCAKKCGINVNEYKLFSSKICKGYFGAKRFDKSEFDSKHMISLAALLETTHRIPNLDYSHLFEVASIICLNKKEIAKEIFKRMCFNVFYQNKDDHSRNFSFLYNEKISSYELSPMYDITQLKNKSEHEMTINGKGNPTEADLIKVGMNAGLLKRDCQKIVNEIKTHIF